MVKSNTTSITPALHAANHVHGGTDPITGDVRIDPLQFTTKNDVTASRVANGTVYRNTSGHIMLVTVSVRFQFSNNSYECVVMSDSATPPTEVVARVERTAGTAGLSHFPITFIVFDNDYYSVDASLDVNNGDLGTWIEWS